MLKLEALFAHFRSSQLALGDGNLALLCLSLGRRRTNVDTAPGNWLSGCLSS